MPLTDPKILFEEIRRNRELLDACPRHLFRCLLDPDEIRAAFGRRVECLNCHGQLLLTDINQYIRRYEAAGGNANDIWPIAQPMPHDIRSYIEDFKEVRYCTVCSAEANELTTECPGTIVPAETRRLVALGEIDYCQGQWRSKVTL